MAATKPLYQRMALNIAAAQWCKEHPKRYDLYQAKAGDDLQALPEENVSETVIDWDESDRDKIVLHSIYHSLDDDLPGVLSDGTTSEWLAFDVMVAPSLYRCAVITVTFPGIYMPCQYCYDRIKNTLEELFREAFMKRS